MLILSFEAISHFNLFPKSSITIRHLSKWSIFFDEFMSVSHIINQP